MQSLPSILSPGAFDCDHRNVTLCRLSLAKCCACADLRPHTERYTTYNDGRRTCSSLNRWSHYCASCKGFWERQIQLSGITPSASRIPEFPKPVIEAPLNYSYVPRYRSSVPSPPTVGGPTPTQNIIPVPPRRRGKRGRPKRQRNDRVDQDSSNTPNIPGQVSASLSTARNGVTSMVSLPKPPPYICPAARLQNQTPHRGNQNGTAFSPARPKTWANLVTPYSQPALLPQQPSALAVPVPLDNSHERAIGGTQTAPAASSSSGVSRRPVNWRAAAAISPLEPSKASDERFPTLNWEGLPVADAADGSWSVDVENDWSVAHGDANTLRSTGGQILGRASGDSVNTSPSSPLEINRSHRAPSATPRASMNARRYAAVQFGDLYNSGAQNFVSEDRQIVSNASNNVPNIQSTANAASDDDPNNRNRGWLDWMGSYMNTAHNRVLEHVNYFDSSQIPNNSPPTPVWVPPQTQPLANDPNARRQTNAQALNAAPRPPPSQNTVENQSTGYRFPASLYTPQAFGNTTVGTPTYSAAATAGLYRPGSISGRRPPPVIQSPPINRHPPIIVSSPVIQSPPIVRPPIVRSPPIIQSSPIATSPMSDDGEWESYPPSRVRQSPPSPVIQSPPMTTSPISWESYPPPRVRIPVRDRTPTPGPPTPGPPVLRSSILDFSTPGEDNWTEQPWDPHTVLISPVASVRRDSSSLDLAKVAEDASILLELFGKTKPRNNEEIGDDHKQMIDNAFEGILKIRKEFRVIAARKNQNLVSLEPPTLEVEDKKLDSECIICYDQIADTVLLPCKHLVLCNTCCDKMGIKEKNIPGRRTVQCPICRVKVIDRLKIFRG